VIGPTILMSREQLRAQAHIKTVMNLVRPRDTFPLGLISSLRLITKSILSDGHSISSSYDTADRLDRRSAEVYRTRCVDPVLIRSRLYRVHINAPITSPARYRVPKPFLKPL